MVFNQTTAPPWTSYTRAVNPQDDPENPYGYIPTMSICILFIALYSVSTTIHIGQSLFYRTWFMLPTAGFGGALETVGWASRLWSSKNVALSTPFTIQITMCIIGPTPLLAANFVIFGRIVQRLGAHYSRLPPKWWTIFFLSCDVVALCVQSVGGAMASTASDSQGAETGGNIVLGGIVFQLAVITLFVICASEFFYRYFHSKPFRGDLTFSRAPLDRRLKLMIGALGFNTLCLFIRAIYRTVELVDGWEGRIIRTQVYFNVLDGAMVILAIFTLNFLHPGFLLRRREPPEEQAMKEFETPSTSQLT